MLSRGFVYLWMCSDAVRVCVGCGVTASKARSIIILAQSGDPDKADARVLRTVLSLLGMKQKVQGHVVAELR